MLTKGAASHVRISFIFFPSFFYEHHFHTAAHNFTLDHELKSVFHVDNRRGTLTVRTAVILQSQTCIARQLLDTVIKEETAEHHHRLLRGCKL